MQGTLYGAYVLADQANAQITAIDASAAIALPGVVGIVDASDITGVNSGLQAPVFAEGKTLYHGQPVALLVANDQRLAYKAAKLVKVVYSNQGPLVLTLEVRLNIIANLTFKHLCRMLLIKNHSMTIRPNRMAPR